MRNYLYLSLLLCVVFSCKKEVVEDSVLPEDYGKGMYIVTDLGVSYLDYKESNAVIQHEIFNAVNGSSIVNPKKIEIDGNKAYIVGNKLYVVNINTFGLLGEVSGFYNSVDCNIVTDNRAFVVDRGESLVQVVDLSKFEIISQLETGDSTKPVSIISNSSTSFVLNGGRIPASKKDTTLVVIKHRDGLVPLAAISNVLNIGENPNSAVLGSQLDVLCKGIYNPDDLSNNTESSIQVVNQYSYEMYDSYVLSGVYNAQNLVKNWNGSKYYFTAVGGVYRLNSTTYVPVQILNVNADVINTSVEQVAINDTTNVSMQMLYMNDLDNPNKVYKYNVDSGIFEDTINVNGNVLDIQFYN